MTPTISDERIAAIEGRREEMQGQLSAGDLPTDRFIALSKEYAELGPVADAAAEVRRLRTERASLDGMAGETDLELREMAAEELASIAVALPAARTCAGAEVVAARCGGRSLGDAGSPRRDRRVMRRRCLRVICSGCTSALPNCRAGGSS